MNALQMFVGQVLGLILVLFLLGLGFFMILGGQPGAKKYVSLCKKHGWKITRRILKTTIGLAADFFKWLHSKV